MYQSPKSCFVFGEFRLDGAERRLLRHGTPISLPPKILDTLLLLVENAGHLVEKDEFMKQLWPGTFVGEDALARNISILRKTLGESSDSQSFIATVPTHGYRFEATVQQVSPPGQAAAEKEPPETRLLLRDQVPAEQFSIEREWPTEPLAAAQSVTTASPRLQEPAIFRTLSPSRRWARRTAFVILALALGTLAGLVTFWWLSPVPMSNVLRAIHIMHRGPMLTSKDPIIVTDFNNTTGDAVFDEALRQGLVAQLEQSPYVEIVSDEQIAGALKLMSQRPGARLTDGLALQVCQRTGGAAVLSSSIAQIGNQYSLTLNALNCSSGALLASARAVARDKNHVLGALDNIASSIRGKLGESLASIKKFNTPLEEATTPSLEALRAYSLAQTTRLINDDYVAAIPLYKEAISLDPGFAMAYASLGTDYFGLGQHALSVENIKKAYELRDRVSLREKFYIESHYFQYAVGDLEKARQVYEAFAHIYPEDWLTPENLTIIYCELGQYENALEASRKVLRLAPFSAISYGIASHSFLLMNRLGEAHAADQEGLAKNLDSIVLRLNLYMLAFLEKDSAAMAQQVAWAAGKPVVEGFLLGAEANTNAYWGRIKESREFSRRAVDSAERFQARDIAGNYEAEAAVREALFGYATEARKHAASALDLSTGGEVQYQAALAFALAGAEVRAQFLANDLARRFPEDTVVRFNYLPTLQGQLALGRHNLSRAVEILQGPSAYDLGQPYNLVFSPSLYPVFVRAEAYLASREGNRAAAEFQKILDHPGVVVNEPIGPLARLGLARVYAMQGDTAKARNAYQDFLALWKDADSDIPVLKQAKAEYVKLQ